MFTYMFGDFQYTSEGYCFVGANGVFTILFVLQVVIMALAVLSIIKISKCYIKDEYKEKSFAPEVAMGIIGVVAAIISFSTGSLVNNEYSHYHPGFAPIFYGSLQVLSIIFLMVSYSLYSRNIFSLGKRKNSTRKFLKDGTIKIEEKSENKETQ